MTVTAARSRLPEARAGSWPLRRSPRAAHPAGLAERGAWPEMPPVSRECRAGRRAAAPDEAEGRSPRTPPRPAAPARLGDRAGLAALGSRARAPRRARGPGLPRLRAPPRRQRPRRAASRHRPASSGRPDARIVPCASRAPMQRATPVWLRRRDGSRLHRRRLPPDRAGSPRSRRPAEESERLLAGPVRMTIERGPSRWETYDLIRGIPQAATCGSATPRPRILQSRPRSSPGSGASTPAGCRGATLRSASGRAPTACRSRSSPARSSPIRRARAGRSSPSRREG